MIPRFFRPVVGYPTYLISEYGRVWSKRSNRLLSNSEDNQGYLMVNLGPDSHTHRIHRLVTKAWLPNPDRLPVVHHKDGDKHNNHTSNLMWTTYKHNTQEGASTKLSNEDVKEIRRLCTTGMYTHQQIGDMFGITRSYVSQIGRGLQRR